MGGIGLGVTVGRAGVAAAMDAGVSITAGVKVAVGNGVAVGDGVAVGGIGVGVGTSALHPAVANEISPMTHTICLILSYRMAHLQGALPEMAIAGANVPGFSSRLRRQRGNWQLERVRSLRQE